jgi:flagellar biogenesis protein FliO
MDNLQYPDFLLTPLLVSTEVAVILVVAYLLKRFVLPRAGKTIRSLRSRMFHK